MSSGRGFLRHPSERGGIGIGCAALFNPIVLWVTVQVPFDLIAQTNVEGGVTGSCHREAVS